MENIPHVSNNLCFSSSFWVDKSQGSMLLFMAQFFSHRIHPKCTQNRLLIQQLRLQSLGLLFSHRKSLSEDWMKIGMLKKNLPSNWDTKAENNSLVWSMDVCSYKSLKEATDLEERLHKEESHSEDPPHFQHLMAHHGTGLQGPWVAGSFAIDIWKLPSYCCMEIPKAFAIGCLVPLRLGWRAYRNSKLAGLRGRSLKSSKIRKVSHKPTKRVFLVQLQFMPHSEAPPLDSAARRSSASWGLMFC